MGETLKCEFCGEYSTFIDDNGSTIGFDCKHCHKFNDVEEYRPE